MHKNDDDDDDQFKNFRNNIIRLFLIFTIVKISFFVFNLFIEILKTLYVPLLHVLLLLLYYQIGINEFTIA